MGMNRTVGKLPGNASWEHYSGEGERVHFYHATGFPLGVYNPLLSKLNQTFKVSALRGRATWPDIGLPPKSRDWQLYADDLIAFIEHECQAPIIGIGHSLGATCTILAAEKRPDLFKSLVLIEPAMLPRHLAWFARRLPKAVMHKFEPAKSTLKKTDIWPSRKEFLASCRKFRAFKRFGAEAFQAMAEHSLIETRDGQFRLAFPKSWEAHTYTQPPNVMANLGRLSMPCVVIRGKPSLFLTADLWQEWQERFPNTRFKENLECGHLLPLENPTICYELICAGLSEIS